MVAVVQDFLVPNFGEGFSEKDPAGQQLDKESDSGHWSSDYAMPFDGLTDEELVDEQAVDTTTNNSAYPLEVAVEIFRIPTPPPLPPSDYRIRKDTNGRIPTPPPLSPSDYKLRRSTSLDARIPTPPPLPKMPQLNLPEVDPDFDINDKNLCIVCLDPNVTTQEEYWDEWEWDPQIHYISTHKTLPCCHRFICDSCLKIIVRSNVDEGRVAISCPHPECGKPFKKNYILEQCDSQTREKYNRFITDVENDGKKKTCPNCCEITEWNLPAMKKLTESDLKVTCVNCQHQWCFRCHAPWHMGLTCKDFRKGHKEFYKWTKGKNRGVANCQKCPTCLVYIQRSTGCNHMTCNRCETEFCYNCGGRFIDFGIIDHDSHLNVWGCSNNYHPDDPALRKLVRGGYLTAKVSYLAGVPIVFVGACALVLVGGAIVLPIYGSIKLYHYAKYKRSISKNKRRH